MIKIFFNWKYRITGITALGLANRMGQLLFFLVSTLGIAILRQIKEGYKRVPTPSPNSLVQGPSSPEREWGAEHIGRWLAGRSYLWLLAKQNKQNKGLTTMLENFALITKNLKKFCQRVLPVWSPTGACCPACLSLIFCLF